MKLGLVTYNNYNFGSALQCYATQTYFAETGLECVLIEKKERRIKAVLHKLGYILADCVASPGSIRTILKQVKAQRAKSLTLTPESLKAISYFKESGIRSVKLSYEELKKKAHSPEYDYFLAGSDQIWNGARIDSYDLYFLRFCPDEKKIAWAPSFGGDRIEKYNLSRYKKYISAFSKLSVRENSGRKLLLDLTGKEADVLCDPVMLLSGGEWKREYMNHTKISTPSRYILLFFIDEPSEKALDIAGKFSREDTEILSFGYRYDGYDTFTKYRHLDGSPYDFLFLIDHACLVVTDSYHATVFSALLHTEFSVFKRNYGHSQNQSVRITDFLKEIDAESRFESGGIRDEIDFLKADLYFERMKSHAENYLSSLPGMTPET